MNTFANRIILALAVLLAPATTAVYGAKKTFREKLAEKIASCEYSFEVVMSKESSRIPPQVLREAKGIIIVHMYRAGFVFGGTGGSAVFMARLPQTGDWGPPVLLDPGGVNVGFQAGVKEINAVFLLMTDEAVQAAYTGRFDLGADAVAVAGPKYAERENFDLFKAPVLVYSTYGGLFAGASIKTGWITPYDRANRELYNTAFGTPEIAMSTWFQVPPEARSLVARVKAAEKGKI